MSCRNGPMDANGYRSTLIASLVPCIDEIRGLNTDLGLRPYRVFLVKSRFSGTNRGRGAEQIVSELEILPAPKVEPFTGLSLIMMTVGTDETGDVRLSEVSMKYDENQLLGRGPRGEALGANETFYWELQNIAKGESWRRKFIVKGIPTLDPGKMMWSLVLGRSGQHDRDLAGNP